MVHQLAQSVYLFSQEEGRREEEEERRGGQEGERWGWEEEEGGPRVEGGQEGVRVILACVPPHLDFHFWSHLLGVPRQPI